MSTPGLALKERATAAFKAGDHTEALSLYAQAAEALAKEDGQARELAACHANMAHIHGLQGKHDSALASSQQAVAADATWGKAHFRVGEALFGLRQYTEAQTAFHAASTAAAPEPRAQHLEKLSVEAAAGGVFFRQVLAGREVCVHARDPVTQKIFGFAEQMQNFMYLIGDATTREVVAVDACWDVQGLLRYAEEEKVRVISGLATHYHFDHVGGSPPPPYGALGITIEGAATLAARGLKVHVHKLDAAAVSKNGGVPMESIIPTEHGTEVQVGSVTLRMLHTPGHTPGSQCMHCAAAKLVLTGDTLFIGSCGRLDLPDCDKAAMHTSLQVVLGSLPPDTKVYPGHNYGGPHTTIAGEKQYGLLKPMPLAQFLAMM